MDNKEIKNRIDFNNIQEKESLGMFESRKDDYLVDSEGNYIVPLSPLEVKLIEKVNELEARIAKLEEKAATPTEK